MNELKFLEEQGVSSSLINKIVKFREVYPVSDEVKNRIIKPAIPFYGKDILEMAIAGILHRTKSHRQKYSGRKSGIYI